jgi:hypothetical protein
MSFTVQHKRSAEENRRPNPKDLTTGQLAINYNAASPGLFFRTQSGTLIKAGPAEVGNIQPALENWTNYSKGEFWVDTSGVDARLRVWTGTRWENLTNFSEATSSLVPEASCTLALGSQQRRWNSLYLCDLELSVRGIIPNTDGAISLGASNKRFSNVYTNDLCLSNEGSQNDVDGTWGSYVIQEGEKDLFLLNKRSGKKFKFVLEEVN